MTAGKGGVLDGPVTMRRPRRIFTALSSALLGVVSATGIGVSQSIVAQATSCPEPAGTLVSDMTSTYPGGTDGAFAEFSMEDTPYVCNYQLEHSVESILLYLPFDGGTDFAEMGMFIGLGRANNGIFQESQLYYFQDASAPVGNISQLNVEGPGGLGNHWQYIKQGVSGCPNACQLYAFYQTDATSWPNIDLPDGDNPGAKEAINGEVLNSQIDQMGTNYFSDLQYHEYCTGCAWAEWNNYAPTNMSPYCNVTISGSTPYEFENWGPSNPEQPC